MNVQTPIMRPTFEEYLAITELDFEWAESYDSKDWDRLAEILAPTLQVNYAKVNNARFDDIPAAKFITMMSAPGFLGDPLVVCQHLLGLSKWVKVSDDEIIVTYQSRAAHMRWKEEGEGNSEASREVAARGHGHGHVEMRHVKVDGVWKWGGIKTLVRWNEHQWEKVFKGVDGK